MIDQCTSIYVIKKNGRKITDKHKYFAKRISTKNIFAHKERLAFKGHGKT